MNRLLAIVCIMAFTAPLWAADVVNRTTKQYHQSVNTPDFPVVDWIINPDLSAVQGFPSRYWKINGDVVTLMAPVERMALDDANAKAARDAEVNQLNRTNVIIAAIKELLREINSDRPTNQRTSAADFKAAVRARLGN